MTSAWFPVSEAPARTVPELAERVARLEHAIRYVLASLERRDVDADAAAAALQARERQDVVEWFRTVIE